MPNTKLFSEVAREVELIKKSTLSSETYKHFQFFVYKKLIPYFGHMCITKVTENEINRYMATVIGKRTLSDDIKYLKTILRYAHNEGYIHRLFPIRNPDPASSAGKYVSKKDLYKLLSSVRDSDMTLQIWMAYSMGMRNGEICHMRWEFINLEHRIIRLPPWFLKTRRMEDRVIPIPDVVYKLLKTRSVGLYLFPSSVNEGQSIRNNKSAWRRLKAQTGVKYRFHDLRHTCITNLVMANVHVLTIRQMCGVSPQVMRRYTHVPVEEMRGALEAGLKKAA